MAEDYYVIRRRIMKKWAERIGVEAASEIAPRLAKNELAAQIAQERAISKNEATTNGLCNEPGCLFCRDVRMMRAMAAVPSVADLKPGPIEPADLPPSAFIRTPPETLSFDNLLSPEWKAPEPEAPSADTLELGSDGAYMIAVRGAYTIRAVVRTDGGCSVGVFANNVDGHFKDMTISEAEALLVVLKTFVRGKR